jgi:predicted metal-dependent hydrolase
MTQKKLQDDFILPTYTIKKSSRAKYVKLRVSAQQGLEIVIPTSFDVKEIPSVILRNKKWIEKQFIRLAKSPLANVARALPHQIELTAMRQTWKVSYIESQTALRIVTRPHQEIVLLGKIKNVAACKKLLIAWLKNIAKIYLTEKLMQVSKITKLSYNKLTIRNQKTRWGSCTSDKSISLNYKIIFLPPNLATHILIHELCHTVHMNHSSKFWRLVGKFDADCKEHCKIVRQFDDCIPAWTID